MSQSLRRGLELLATFDSDHTDAGNGVVKDFSGKERHLQASGGPTYGQASPVGEAVSFDGTDDEFVTEDADDITSTDKRTAVIVAKWDGGNAGADKGVYLLGGNFTFGFRNPSVDVWRVEAADSNGSFENITWVEKEDEYVRLLAEWDTGTLRFVNLSNGSLIGSKSFANDGLENEEPKKRVVGNEDDIGGDAPFSGDISFVAEWSRTLSDSEIDELGRMTDRMVSKL